MAVILSVQGVSKTYQSGGKSLAVLQSINFEVEEASAVAIVGPSGSGKTTLLGLCAGLDRASEGRIVLNSVPLDDLNEDERARVRNQYVGFVFQNFQLLPTLTALENVMLPLELAPREGTEARAREWLERVGLGERVHHLPKQLSGGEQQRVALARAFVTGAELVFADEPTGNLDPDTGERIIETLFSLNREVGTTLVLVTHDHALARRCDRCLRLDHGRLETMPLAEVSA